MLAALTVLLIAHRIVYAIWIPEVDRTIWLWLALSGLVGLALGIVLAKKAMLHAAVALAGVRVLMLRG